MARVTIKPRGERSEPRAVLKKGDLPMSLASASRRTRPAKKRAESPQRVVLHDIDWNAYKTLCAATTSRRVRMTYDRGILEIMVTSFEHDRYSAFLAHLIVALARFFQIKIGSAGSFTHQRPDLEKGLEPDQCFYLASIGAIKGKKQIDLTKDPPPDLAIEVDVSYRAMDRMSIYAALGVPEVWRFDTKTIDIYLLKQGAYEKVPLSPTFPDIPLPELVKFLELGIREDDSTMLEEFEKWLPKVTKRKRKKA